MARVRIYNLCKTNRRSTWSRNVGAMQLFLHGKYKYKTSAAFFQAPKTRTPAASFEATKNAHRSPQCTRPHRIVPGPQKRTQVSNVSTMHETPTALSPKRTQVYTMLKPRCVLPSLQNPNRSMHKTSIKSRPPKSTRAPPCMEPPLHSSRSGKLESQAWVSIPFQDASPSSLVCLQAFALDHG